MARAVRRGSTDQEQGRGGRRLFRAWIAVAAAVLLSVALPSRAQTGDGGGGGDSGGSSAGSQNSKGGTPTTIAAGTGEVTLDIERFGLGDSARPGEIAAVRIRALDQGAKPREVLIRLEGKDPDGDTPYFERQVVLNPNSVQGIWLYPLIPRNFDTSDGMVLSAYEVPTQPEGGEKAAAAEAVSHGKLGALLARTVVRMKARIAPYDGVVAVVGTGSLSYGLADYAVTDGQGSWSASGHEIIRTIEGLRPSDLPDRWMGYSSFDAVVWGSGDPLELREGRAAALREWVQRGGHLIIVMPVAGQSWTNATANELHDILPNMTITRREAVDMSLYAPILTRKPQARLPKDSVVYSFEPVQGALPGEAIRVLAGPDGSCVVARRLVGSGAVTMIGLDLNHRMVTSQDLVSPDIFWNRVLGKRGMVRSAAELAGIQNRSFQSRDERLFEVDIPAAIGKSGKSAAGLLLALIVFALYWLVAGPGGYALLKKFGMVRHAWLGFFVAAGVFTAIAWGGAMLLRPSRVEVGHLTILDHVYGQPVDRARSWMSVLVPWYGEATIEVGDAPKAGELAGRGGGDVLMPWTSPDQAQSGQDIFPDARGYEVQSRSPRSLTVPTRSTVKQVRADWSGGPAWKMPTPVGVDPANPGTGGLRLNEDGTITGRLVHGLPGPLHDVVILVVRGQKALLPPLTSGFMISRTNAHKLPDNRPWAPGEELDVGAIANTTKMSAAEVYFKDLLSAGSSQEITVARAQPQVDASAVQRFAALSFFSQFEPPQYTDFSTRDLVARRTETHGWDLGMWFTQPCIIIIGHLGTDKEPMPSPIPVRINGDRVDASGWTMVRWMYPLSDNPPPYKGDAGQGDPPAAPASGDEAGKQER